MKYHVALPFTRTEEGSLAPGIAMECPNAGSAIHRAEAMSRSEANSGAVAFSREGNPDVGEFEDAVVLKTFGDVPDDFGHGL